MARNDGGLADGFGAVLRHARLRLGLTYADVERETRVRQHHLEALEEEDLRALPPAVFATGLLRTYARFLGLDDQPLVAALQAQLSPPAKPTVRPASSMYHAVQSNRPSLVGPFICVAVLIAITAYLYRQYSGFSTGALAPPRPPPAVAAVAPTTVTSVTPFPTTAPIPTSSPTPTVVATLAATPTTTSVPQVAVGQAAVTATASPHPVSTPPPTATAAPPTPTRAPPSPTASPTPAGVRIDTSISGRVWMQVETDGQLAFSGIANSGDKKSFTAKKSISIWSGNSSFVDITYNGKHLGPLGAPGEVVKEQWTAS